MVGTTAPPRAHRRPRLSVVPANDQTPGREIDWSRNARI